MSPLPPELKDELQREYVAGFDQKLKELLDALKLGDRAALENLFHKLAGSGLTYEMEKISVISRKAEELLKISLDTPAILQLIKELAAVFAEEKKKLQC